LEAARALRDHAVFLVSTSKELANEYGFDSLTAFRVNPARGQPIVKFDKKNLGRKPYVEAWIKDQSKLAVVDINTKNSESVLEAKNQLLLLAIYPSSEAWKLYHKEKFSQLATKLLSSERLESSLSTNAAGLKPDIRFSSLNGKLYANYVKNVFGFDTDLADAKDVKVVIVETERKVFFDRDIHGKPFGYDEEDDLIVDALIDASEHRLIVISMHGKMHSFFLETLRRLKKYPILIAGIVASAFAFILYLYKRRDFIKGIFQDPESNYRKIE
jgi:hypothetical protein